jgi:hypothetical protein
MSIDGRGSSPSRAAQDTISALKSERDRLKYERDEARRDRDAFCNDALERTQERDRARRVAVELEQQLHVAAEAIETAYSNSQDDMQALEVRMLKREYIDPYELARVRIELACSERIRTAFLDRSDPDFGRAA